MATVTSLDARIRRLERVAPRCPTHVESWLVDGDTATDRRTGETIAASALAERPASPDTMRIVRVIIDSVLRDEEHQHA
jgi:hypothetical protein